MLRHNSVRHSLVLFTPQTWSVRSRVRRCDMTDTPASRILLSCPMRERFSNLSTVARGNTTVVIASWGRRPLQLVMHLTRLLAAGGGAWVCAVLSWGCQDTSFWERGHIIIMAMNKGLQSHSLDPRSGESLCGRFDEACKMCPVRSMRGC